MATDGKTVDYVKYQWWSIRLRCGSCGFDIGTLMPINTPSEFGPQTISLKTDDRSGHKSTDSGVPDRHRQRGLAGLPPRKRDTFDCPNRKCRMTTPVRQERLARAFYEAAQAGRRELVLGIDL
jgi:hypothetical protein